MGARSGRFGLVRGGAGNDAATGLEEEGEDGAGDEEAEVGRGSEAGGLGTEGLDEVWEEEVDS